MKFTDKNGREWSCEITVATVRRVRAGADVDLLEALEGDLVYKLGVDIERFVQVLWCIVEPQAAAADVTPESFADGLAGDHLGNALDAFYEGLRSFFSRPDQRALIGQVIEKTRQAMGAAYQIGSEQLGKIDAEQIVRQEAAKLSQHETPSG